MFSPRARRAWLLYVLATLPIVGIASLLSGGWFATDPRGRYIIGWVLVSGIYTLPALLVSWSAAHRVSESDRRFWRTWCLGMALVNLIGVCLVLQVVTGWSWVAPLTVSTVLAAIVVFTLDLVRMMQSRSGDRDILIDYVELAMGTVLIAAPFALWFGDAIVHSPDAWFAVPAAMTAVAMVATLLWSVMLFVRIEPGRRLVEGMGVAVAVVLLVNSCVLVAQGLSGFTLAFAPLMVLQALAMALSLFTPLNLPTDIASGLDRLPPQAQVRTGRLVAAGCFVVIPVLAVQASQLGVDRSWVMTSVFSVLSTILVLALLRQQLTMHETRRLYSEVERAAEQRRQLLADVLARADEDRHRVAAQLHEQAVGAYAALVALAQGANDPDRSRVVRDDMARQAESLRQLMMAIRPIEVASTRPESLVAPISAYLDGLYGWRPTPMLVVDVDEDLHLDWTTETIAIRILQEALRNVRRHAHASLISIGLRATDAGVELTVADDGTGFDPATTMFESGIATMRTFAGYTGGSCTVDSEPGVGTTVRVLLGLGVVDDGSGTDHADASLTDASLTDASLADVSLTDVAPGIEEPVPAPTSLRLVRGGLPG